MRFLLIRKDGRHFGLLSGGRERDRSNQGGASRSKKCGKFEPQKYGQKIRFLKVRLIYVFQGGISIAKRLQQNIPLKVKTEYTTYIMAQGESTIKGPLFVCLCSGPFQN